MRKITKALTIAAVVALGGVSLTAVAQSFGPGYGPQGYGPMGSGRPGFMNGPRGPGMMSGWSGPAQLRFADPAAWLGTLKTDLVIRPEQAAAWNDYAKAVQDSATQMRALRGSMDFDAMRAMPWKDLQASLGGLHDKQAQAYIAVKTAANTLLPVLDETQKTKAQAELPGLVQAGSRVAWRGGPPMMGRGMGMMFGPMSGYAR
jgi:hypothetical protein